EPVGDARSERPGGHQSRISWRERALVVLARGTMQTSMLLWLVAAGSFFVPNASADTAADQSFANRCAAAGVIQCIGFEDFVGQTSPAQCRGGSWPTAGHQCYGPAGDGTVHAFLDQSVFASGDGTGKTAALRLDTTNVAAANDTGDYFIGWGQSFGQNS